MGSYSTLHSATFVFGIHNSVARSMIFSKYAGNVDQWELTKYVVGAKANPPKKPSNPPKKGMVMATNVVKAAEVDTPIV